MKCVNYHGQIMILSAGRTAYCGDVEDAPSHFASIGWPLKANTNPAEYFLDLVNADFVPIDEVNKILAAWPASASAQKLNDNLASAHEAQGKGGRMKKQGNKSTFVQEIGIMFKRHGILVVRDPVLYIGRAIIFLISNIYFSFIYWKARERHQDQVFNRVWLIIWFIAVAANMGVVAVFALNDEFKSVAKEIKNGMVSPVSYVFAKAVLELPVCFVTFPRALLLLSCVFRNPISFS
jgi:hypothetical protein